MEGETQPQSAVVDDDAMFNNDLKIIKSSTPTSNGFVITAAQQLIPVDSAPFASSSRVNCEQTSNYDATFKPKRIEEVIQALSQVEGFDNESWGDAVNLNNSREFYPKQLTSRMNDEEYESFIRSDEVDASSTGLATLSNVNVPLPSSASSEAHVMMEVSHVVDGNQTIFIPLDVGQLQGNVHFVNPYEVPTDPRRPPPARNASELLEADLEATSVEEISHDYVLRLILPEGCSLEANGDDQAINDTTTESNLSTNLQNAQSESDSEKEHGDNEETEPVTGIAEEEGDQFSAEADMVEETFVDVEGDSNEPNILDSELIEFIQEIPVGNGDHFDESLADKTVEFHETESEENDYIDVEDEEDQNEISSLHQQGEMQIIPNPVGSNSFENEKVEKECSVKSAVSDTDSPVSRSRQHKQARSTSVDCNASTISVGSSASSHSSIRACSVVLTRLEPSSSPISCRQFPSTSTEGQQKNNSKTHIVSNDENNDDLPLSDSKETLSEACSCKESKLKGNCNCNSHLPSDFTGKKESKNKKKVGRPKKINNQKEPSVHNDSIDASHDCSSTPVIQVKCEPVDTEEVAVNNTSRRKRKTNVTNTVVVKKERLDKPELATTVPVVEREEIAIKREEVWKMSTKEVELFIKEEGEKSRPDYVRLSAALTRTYKDRKILIYEKAHVELTEIRSCPGLKHYPMVKEEYGRIKDDIDKMKHLEDQLDTVCYSALNPKPKPGKIMPPKKKHPIWQSVIDFYKNNESKALNNPLYLKVPGILVVCFEFAEKAVVTNLLKILKKGEKLKKADVKKMSTPTIVVKESEIFNVEEESDIWIYVDGTKYLKVPNMYEAVLCTFATYYLCNINYDPKLKTLFEFFDMLNGNHQTTFIKSTAWPPPKKKLPRKPFVRC